MAQALGQRGPKCADPLEGPTSRSKPGANTDSMLMRVRHAAFRAQAVLREVKTRMTSPEHKSPAAKRRQTGKI